MTALGLTLAGLAPGLFSALAYWLIHAAIREMRASAREVEAIAASLAGQAFARALRSLATLGCTVELEHIEVLKLRAAKLSDRLHYAERQPAAAAIVDRAIRAGDRVALEALLRACDSP